MLYLARSTTDLMQLMDIFIKVCHQVASSLRKSDCCELLKQLALNNEVASRHIKSQFDFMSVLTCAFSRVFNGPLTF